MFIIGAAKLVSIYWNNSSIIFIANYMNNKKYLTLSDKNRIREWRLPPNQRRICRLLWKYYCWKFKSLSVAYIPEEVEDFKSLMLRLKKY